MDVFTAFFTGAAAGTTFGIFIMAVILAVGRRRDETE